MWSVYPEASGLVEAVLLQVRRGWEEESLRLFGPGEWGFLDAGPGWIAAYSEDRIGRLPE